MLKVFCGLSVKRWDNRRRKKDISNKKALGRTEGFCTEGGTRTRTNFRSHAPETCMSTNSTTSACATKVSQKTAFGKNPIEILLTFSTEKTANFNMSDEVFCLIEVRRERTCAV